jgi:hypothetical protein
MNSEGEKMPPDEPAPRLVEVAKSLQTKRSASSQPAAPQPLRIAWIVEVVAELSMQSVDQPADEQHAEYVPRVAAGHLLECILRQVQHPDEQCAGDAADRAEQHVETKRSQCQRRVRKGQSVDRRHTERGLRAEEQAANERRGAGCGGDRQEGVDADLGQHQLDREHHAADRCIEGRSDARPGTGGDQCDALTGRHLDELPESRA